MSTYSNILIINGPNLNLLGTRETKKYCTYTLEEIIQDLNLQAKNIGIKLNHFQSNAEHKIINCIHQSVKKIDFIIINPAAFTHTSLAIRDAFLTVNIPFIEIHISNIFSREKYRKHSFLSDLAIGVISGLGTDGYSFALRSAKNFLLKNSKK